MAESEKGAVGRRRFLKGAAATAATLVGKGEAAGAQQAPDDGHEHEHQTVPEDIALRVRALETVLVEKGMVDPAALDQVVDTYENKVGTRIWSIWLPLTRVAG